MSKSYIVARTGGLHFRIRIPADLQDLFSRREIKRSLTHLPKTHARAEALRVSCLALDFFNELRMARNNLSDDQLRSLAERWLNDQVREQVTAYRMARRTGERLPDPDLDKPDLLDAKSLAVSEFLDQIRFGAGETAKAAYELWEPLAILIAESAGVKFAELSPEEAERLIVFTISAESRRLELLSRHSPDFSGTFWTETQHGAATLQPSLPKQAGGGSPTLRQAWDLCVQHYRAQGRKSWEISETDAQTGKRASKNQHAKWIREDLYELWGANLRICEISWQHLKELRDCFQTKYPARRKRKTEYRSMTLREIVDGPKVPEKDRIRGSGKDTKFRLARDFFRFLRAHPSTKPHFDQDADQVLKAASDPLSTYEPWTLSEIRTILESEEVHSRFRRKGPNYHPAGMFWLLAMLAHTGARQQEIMGLRPEDVILDTDHPVIHIREHQYRPQVKTEVSVRWVPIHKHLLQMGLADWIRFRARIKQPTLWPVSDRGSNYWADRFREDITKPLGLYQGRKKVMHSLRGTFDSLASNAMPTEPRRLITGHVGQGTDYRHYLRQLDEFIPTYSEHMNKIDLRLDLEKLERLWRASLPSR